MNTESFLIIDGIELNISSVLNFPEIAWFPKLFLEVSHQGHGYVDAVGPNPRKTTATHSRQSNVCFKFS